MSSFITIEWKDDKVRMIDQRKLPTVEEYIDCETYEDVAFCIKDMVIRGAPAIGVAAAMGIALGALKQTSNNKTEFLKEFDGIVEVIKGTRPTAVNLFWASNIMKALVEGNPDLSVEELRTLLVSKAIEICKDDIKTCKEIGRHGADLIEDGMTVMTHCNAGALATAGYGTALGVIRAAVEQGKKIDVIANETRPFLQGARLTAWELDKDGIPVTLITDNMAGYVMSKGMVDVVVVGADRVASNGDVANKIGTYSLSILAKAHGIPFYVAAPVSTIDFECPSGEQIPIEQRNTEEVTHIAGKLIAPDVRVFNPAFDITPNDNVAGLITEKGVSQSPYSETLKKLNKD